MHEFYLCELSTCCIKKFYNVIFETLKHISINFLKSLVILVDSSHREKGSIQSSSQGKEKKKKE